MLDLFKESSLKISNQWIIHVDLDAFYASVEERLHPEYQGLPLIVGPDPKKYKRGVVLTANYVARKYGVRSAMPINQAYKLCPDGIFIFSGFKYYNEASHEVMIILKQFDSKEGNFLQASIDEAYLNITDLVIDTLAIEDIITQLQRKILYETKLSCSIGAAPTKALAKIASDLHKPKGITIIRPEELPTCVADLSLNKISGIGKKTYAALEQKGYTKIADIIKYPRKHWSKKGLLLYIWDVAHGLTSAELAEKYHSKSTSIERTFGEDINEPAQLKSILSDMTEKLLDDIAPFQTISIKVRYANFKTYTRSKTLLNYVTAKDFKSVQEIVQELFEEFLTNINGGFRLLGVRASNFKQSKLKQQSLNNFVQ